MPCSEGNYREEHLAPQFDAIVKGISIDGSMHEWIVAALKDSHKDETQFHQEALGRLQGQLQQIKQRLDAMYLDKLDGKISEQYWLEKSRGWQTDQDRILSEIQAHQVADHHYYNDGFKLLELA